MDDAKRRQGHRARRHHEEEHPIRGGARLTSPNGAPLGRKFYERRTLEVARDLLGCLLVHRFANGETASGIIVEVEAYCGPRDLACHSARGRRTARNEVMYGPAGHAYVYFTYGMHHCFNVVTRGAGIAEAVLIRAAVPVDGLDGMRTRRGRGKSVPDPRLASGPGNLCRAFGIDRSLNGADLTDSELTIHRDQSFTAARIRRGPRIGIDYAKSYISKPWRLYVREEPAVSGRNR